MKTPTAQVVAVPQFARVTDYAGVWAIEPMRGTALWQVARDADLAQHVRQSQAQQPTRRSLTELVPVPGAAKSGAARSVAVIRVEGVLMKAATSFGGSGTVQLRREIRKAANDPEVVAILLVIDSPGGTVAGTMDLANEVIRANGGKPVWAFVQDLCASAAYWVASQCGKVYANNNTADVGSIGTFATIYDISEALSKEGVKTFHFATGPLKGAGAPGTEVTEEQRSYFQGLVNASQGEFDAAVKKGRGVVGQATPAGPHGWGVPGVRSGGLKTY